VKTVERALARELRQLKGMSIKAIATELGVSQSSVSRWVRDVELSYAQRAALAARNPALSPEFNGSKTRARQALEIRRAHQAHGRDLARRGEPLFVAGCMLYWGEGAKDRNQLGFSNSDPDMAALFMRFLRTYFDVGDDMVRVTCYLFADHAERQFEIEQFWLDRLDLPRERLARSFVNTYSKRSKRLRKNKLPYGTCKIVVSRQAVIQGIYGALQELGGFERPEWAER
jgi:transcriptional regulator with XRE-family HTH domain